MPFAVILGFSLDFSPAPARHAVQWQPRVRGLPYQVLARGSAAFRPAEGHQRPAGKGVHHRGPGGVDGVWAADPGLQRHWGRTMERSGARSDAGVRWVRAPRRLGRTNQRIFSIWCLFWFSFFSCWPIKSKTEGKRMISGCTEGEKIWRRLRELIYIFKNFTPLMFSYINL